MSVVFSGDWTQESGEAFLLGCLRVFMYSLCLSKQVCANSNYVYLQVIYIALHLRIDSLNRSECLS